MAKPILYPVNPPPSEIVVDQTLYDIIETDVDRQLVAYQEQTDDPVVASVLKDQADAEGLVLSSVETVESSVSSFEYSLITDLDTTYSPVILLSMEETGGTVAYDVANGNDAAYNSVVLGTILPTDLFMPAGRGVNIDATADDIRWLAGDFPVMGPDFSGVLIWNPSNLRIASVTGRIWEVQTSTGGFEGLGKKASGSMGYYNGAAWVDSNRDPQLSLTMLGWTISATLCEIFENGLPYWSTPSTNRVTNGVYPAVIGDASYGSPENIEGWEGYAYLHMETGAPLSRTSHYEIFQQASDGQQHFYYETLGAMNGAVVETADAFTHAIPEVKIPPSKVVCHLPLWEETGTQAIDVSGNENHGSFISGPVLGEPAVTDEFIYSSRMDGTSYITVPHIAGADPAIEDVTIIMAFQTNGLASVLGHATYGYGLFGKAPAAPERTELIINNTGYIQLQMYDGIVAAVTLTTAVAYDDDLPHIVAAVFDNTNNLLRLYIDGEFVLEGDTSALTMTSSSASLYRFGASYLTGITHAYINGATIINEALNDAELRMATSLNVTGGAALAKKWNLTYDPIFLLNFEEELAAPTVFDYSGSANDLTVEGSPVFQRPALSLFPNAGKGMDITLLGQRAIRVVPGTTTAFWTWFGIWNENYTAATTQRIYDHVGAGTGRIVVWSDTGVFSCYRGGPYHRTTRYINVNNLNALYGVTTTPDEIHFWENGIKFSTIASTDYLIATASAAWGDYITDNAPSYGSHHVGGLIDKSLGDGSQYQMFQDATGGQKHHWYETLGLLGSKTGLNDGLNPLVNIPPDYIFCHLPLWEEAGGQAIDVSGKENHGAFTDGPTLGELPNFDDEVYTVKIGSGNIASVDTAQYDFSTDFTLSFSYRSERAEVSPPWNTMIGQAKITGSTSYILLYNFSTADRRLAVYDGTTQITGSPVAKWVYGEGSKRGVIRFNWTTNEAHLFWDGVKGATLDISSIVKANLGSMPFTFAKRVDGVGYVPDSSQRVGAITLFNKALTDEECLFLSGGPEVKNYLNEWKERYSPELLLGFDESIGNVARDSSGNNNDVSWGLNPGTQGVDGLWENDKLAADLDGTGYGDLTATDGIDAQNITSTFSVKTTATPGVYKTFMDTDGASRRILACHPTLGIYVYDGAYKYSSPEAYVNNGEQILLSYVSSNSETKIYFNGIKVSEAAASAAGLTWTLESHYAHTGTDASYGYAKHSLAMVNKGQLSATSQYDLWKDVSGGQKHYHYEVLGKLSGATYDVKDGFSDDKPLLKHPPTSLVSHLPLWEEVGPKHANTAGDQIFADSVNGPLLGQPPLTSDAIYSVLCNGTSYISTTHTIGDIRNNAFTVATIWKSQGVTNSYRDVFGSAIAAANNLQVFNDAQSGAPRIKLYSNTTTALSVVSDIIDLTIPHVIVVRGDGAGIFDLFVDGVKYTLDATAHIGTALDTTFKFGSGSAVWALEVYIQTPTIFNAALSDADCLFLSQL